jgi:predicted nucleotidyltransferase component of viral defense system
MEPDCTGAGRGAKLGGILMFSKEYLQNLSRKTGFLAESLQKQMTLLDILREIGRNALLKKKFALKGGTSLNLFWFPLPRLSVDIDLNYIGSHDRQEMLTDRTSVEQELKKLIQSRGITIQHAPSDEHAGAKWRLRSPSSFGGHFTLELDLNYMMRIPVYGIREKEPYQMDEDYSFIFSSVSFEELFAGKIKALLERSAARDLFDVFMLTKKNIRYDFKKLKSAAIFFGITGKHDWRKRDLETIDSINQQMLHVELNPLLRQDDVLDIGTMKRETKKILTRIITYDESEKIFMDEFLDHGRFTPELLFGKQEHARLMKHHPAVLWKLQNVRKFKGLE